MGIVKKTDIYEQDLFEPLKKQAKETLVALDKMTAGIKSQHSEVKKLSVAFNGTSKSVRDLMILEKESESLMQKKIATERAEVKLKQDILKLEVQQTKETERLTKAKEKELKATKEANSEYSKQSKRLNELRKEYKDLILVQGKETAQTMRMRKEIMALDASLKKVDATVGQHQRSVGNYQKALGGLRNMLGQLGLAFGVFQILKDSFNIISGFEKATASLSAITGATGNDLENLKGTILDLATEMKVGVTETTKLFEIVGSQMPQLLKDAEGLRMVSESSIILSKASGESIESSTLAMAAVMNQFSLEATEANRVMNVLAAGSLVGSAGISDVSEAMKNFGSVAAGANITVEESVALIEVLGKFGVVGAESGTKLRGSILKLQQASFGYASGQFEVNDALSEAKAKMDSLGTALEQDAFLQKTFGAENIATGRILLSNIDLFEEYTKGVTGTSVATDQARINSDTMSTVLKELKAAWENLVIKWSEGTDVLGGLKDILRFVADNLEAIIGWVIKGISVWASYRIALMLVNKEGTGFIQIIGNMIKGLSGASAGLKNVKIGFASWVGLAAALLPLMIDLVKATYDMYAGTTALDNATEKYNEKIDEERAKMDLLRVEILAAIGDKEKMEELINRINSTYGTTLENIEDETMMMNQLWEAYQKVNAEMEKRIMQQVLEEELVNLFKAKREIEKMTGGSTLFGGGGKDQFLTDVNAQISEIQAKLFKLNNSGGIGKLGGAPVIDEGVATITDTTKTKGETAEQRRQRELSEFRNQNELVRLEFEKNLIKMGFSEEQIRTEMAFLRTKHYQDELKMIQNLGFVTRDEFIKTENAAVKFAESNFQRMEKTKVERINTDKEIVDSNHWMNAAIMAAAEQQRKIEEEAAARRLRAIDEIKNQIDQINKMIQDMMQSNISMIDTQIAKQQQMFDDSKTREQSLRDIAKERHLDATESIDAEREYQKEAQREIEKLESKKRQLELMIAAMTLLGQGKSVSDIKSSLSDIKSFVEGFSQGGYTGDGGKYEAKGVVHAGEFVVDKETTSAMGLRGADMSDFIDKFNMNRAASIIQSSYDKNSSISVEKYDSILYSKMDEQIKVLKDLPNKMPQHDMGFNATVGTLEYTRKTNLRKEKTSYLLRN